MSITMGAAERRVFPMLRPGLPKTSEPDRWLPGRAERHTIGWFDLEAVSPEPSEEDETGEGGGGAEAGSLSPAADLLRRLAAVLQPPPSSLYTPNGFLE